MKNKKFKHWKIFGSLLAVSTLALTIPFVVSCASVDNSNKNTTSDSNSSKSDTDHDKTTSTTPSVNGNNALPISSDYSNGSLSNLTASWNNLVSGAVNVSKTGEISLSSNAPSGSVINYYISNNSNSLIQDSLLLNTIKVVDGVANTITLPESIIDKLDVFTYYVFAIISNKDASYPVQTTTVVLNLSTNYPISITNGLLSNGNISAVCKDTTITLSVASIKDASYTWQQIDVATNTVTTLNSNTNTLNYPTYSVGYVSIQCKISINDQTTTSVLNFYVSDFANLTITNSNLINNILTITDTTQTLGLKLSDSFIPTSTQVIYQWYKKGLDTNSYDTNLSFVPTNNTSTTYNLNNLVPTYTYDFKVMATFTYNNNVYTIESNIVHVYYDSDIGSVSIDVNNKQASSSYTLNNGESITLTANTSAINNTDLPYLQYQWQTLINGNWTNIASATNNTYTLTEKNNTINQIRVSVSLPQNWNDGSIYSSAITVQAPAISTTLQNEIYNKAVAYFANSTDFSDMWISYFTNSDNSNYWWFWQTLTSGWWKCGGHFAYKDGSNYVSINDTNVLSYLKIASVSLVNGSFSNGNFTGNPRLVFNMQPLTDNVYIDASTGAINLPANETFAFSSPIYVANTSSYADDYNFSVASNGSFTYSINVYGINNSYNQSDMKYYWNSSADSAWGLNFNSSILASLKSDGFFSYQTTNNYTVLYNWLNNPNSMIYINNSTTPALPNFYNQVLNQNLSININPSQESSSTKLITFNYGTMTLSVNPALSNSAKTTFSYKWQSQISGSIEWTNLNNTTNSYTLTYPKVSLTKDELILYKVTITTDYDNQTYSATETFYVDWLPSNASTITN